ncbi:MAG: alcohol dehydrogenase catalytic domain-containing protein [Actinomycetota bacterium]
MRAAYYEAFEGPIEMVDLPDPTPERDGVVVQVEATGLCRSDWHGWMGHDPDITLPHVPGHEVAGIVVARGTEVERWKVGDRVTVPFAAGCGDCEECRAGNEQVCAFQFQPGFTGWGSFAQLVALRYADHNLVPLPDDIDWGVGAVVGCRFATAFRAVVDQGRVAAGEEVVVFGCGGVGLSAIQIAGALGARVTAIDPSRSARELALASGADVAIDGTQPGAVVEATGGGAHVSIDAIGNREVVATAINALRPRGRHVQAGLLPHSFTPVPLGRVIGKELEILGSHGMAAHRYQAMLSMILDGRLDPDRLITRRIPLSAVTEALPAMGDGSHPGITVIDRLDA